MGGPNLYNIIYLYNIKTYNVTVAGYVANFTWEHYYFIYENFKLPKNTTVRKQLLNLALALLC